MRDSKSPSHVVKGVDQYGHKIENTVLHALEKMSSVTGFSNALFDDRSMVEMRKASVIRSRLSRLGTSTDYGEEDYLPNHFFVCDYMKGFSSASNQARFFQTDITKRYEDVSALEGDEALENFINLKYEMPVQMQPKTMTDFCVQFFDYLLMLHVRKGHTAPTNSSRAVDMKIKRVAELAFNRIVNDEPITKQQLESTLNKLDISPPKGTAWQARDLSAQFFDILMKIESDHFEFKSQLLLNYLAGTYLASCCIESTYVTTIKVSAAQVGKRRSLNAGSKSSVGSQIEVSEKFLLCLKYFSRARIVLIIFFGLLSPTNQYGSTMLHYYEILSSFLSLELAGYYGVKLQMESPISAKDEKDKDGKKDKAVHGDEMRYVYEYYMMHIAFESQNRLISQHYCSEFLVNEILHIRKVQKTTEINYIMEAACWIVTKHSGLYGVVYRSLPAIEGFGISNVEILRFSYCNISSQGVSRMMPTLKQNSKLTHLALQHCRLGDDGLKLLSSVLPYLPLMFLDLTDNAITDTSIVHCHKQLLYLTNLEMLGLGQNKIGQRGAQVIADLMHFLTNLAFIDLDSNNLREAGAATVIQGLFGMRKFRVLGLSANGITGDTTVKLLRNYITDRRSTTMRYIGLRKNNLSQEHIQSIKGALTKRGHRESTVAMDDPGENNNSKNVNQANSTLTAGESGAGPNAAPTLHVDGVVAEPIVVLGDDAINARLSDPLSTTDVNTSIKKSVISAEKRSFFERVQADYIEQLIVGKQSGEGIHLGNVDNDACSDRGGDTDDQQAYDVCLKYLGTPGFDPDPGRNPGLPPMMDDDGSAQHVDLDMNGGDDSQPPPSTGRVPGTEFKLMNDLTSGKTMLSLSATPNTSVLRTSDANGGTSSVKTSSVSNKIKDRMRRLLSSGARNSPKQERKGNNYKASYYTNEEKRSSAAMSIAKMVHNEAHKGQPIQESSREDLETSDEIDIAQNGRPQGDFEESSLDSVAAMWLEDRAHFQHKLLQSPRRTSRHNSVNVESPTAADDEHSHDSDI